MVGNRTWDEDSFLCNNVLSTCRRNKFCFGSNGWRIWSTFQGGIALQYGPTLSISAFTKSSTAPQITTSTDHGLVSGDVVVFQSLYQTSSTGMPQLCNIPFVVTYVSSTEFTITFTTTWEATLIPPRLLHFRNGKTTPLSIFVCSRSFGSRWS